MRLLPWAAAPRAASSIVASNASSGGRAPRRRGRCIPPLAAAAAAAAPRPRAEHPRALPGVPATSSRPLSPQDAGGVCKVLCPSNLLPRLRPAASGPPVRAVPPEPSGGSLAEPSRSVLSCPFRTSGGRVSPARIPKSAPCARGLWSRAPSREAAATPPAARAPSLALSLPQLVTFHQLSSPAPEPRPMADTGPGRRPSALCCHLSTPTPSDVPESCCSSVSRTPTSPPPPRLKPAGGPEPCEPSRPFDRRRNKGSRRLFPARKPVRG